MPGWDGPARPAVYKAPIGAQVASPQSPILRWSTSRISALTLRTRGAKQKSGFDSTSGFANYKVSGFANYRCPVLLAPRQKPSLLFLLAGWLPRHCQRVARPLLWRCFEGVTMELRWGFEGVTKGFKGNQPPVTVSGRSGRRDELARNRGAGRGFDAALAPQPFLGRPGFAFVDSTRFP